MDIHAALDEFGAALKSQKAAEIAYVGALGTNEVEAARRTWTRAQEEARVSGLRLLATPARSPADLVMKAKALRWQCPDGVPIESPAVLGGAEPPAENASFPTLAMHYLTRDLLALAQ